jgi:hypothetical protein
MGHVTDARIAIEGRLYDNWQSPPGTLRTPIRYWSSNAPFEIPEAAAWIALSVNAESGRQVSLGDGVQLHRYLGQIVVQVFVPERTGSQDMDTYLDLLDPIWRCAQFSYGDSGLITCRTPDVEAVGTADGWFQKNLKVAYRRDRQH